MFNKKILKGEVFEAELISYLLELRRIKTHHVVGHSSIKYPPLDIELDARLLFKLLDSLESVAIVCKIDVQPLSADSSLEDLLGLDSESIVNLAITIEEWLLLKLIDQGLNS